MYQAVSENDYQYQTAQKTALLPTISLRQDVCERCAGNGARAAVVMTTRESDCAGRCGERQLTTVLKPKPTENTRVRHKSARGPTQRENVYLEQIGSKY